MPPKFFYFDLGMVLLKFDRQKAVRQMAEVAGLDDGRQVYDVLFGDDQLQLRYERGQISTQEHYETFSARTGTSPPKADLFHAASDIFSFNVPMLPVVSHLHAAGCRLGVLSNTCEIHWQHITSGRFAIFPGLFEQTILSYQVGATKPSPEIFQAALEQAGVQPHEIFFTDDVQEHVTAAREVGLDAVQFTGAGPLVEELHRRDVRFNY